jgi:hypothetical protein
MLSNATQVTPQAEFQAPRMPAEMRSAPAPRGLDKVAQAVLPDRRLSPGEAQLAQTFLGTQGAGKRGMGLIDLAGGAPTQVAQELTQEGGPSATGLAAAMVPGAPKAGAVAKEAATGLKGAVTEAIEAYKTPQPRALPPKTELPPGAPSMEAAAIKAYREKAVPQGTPAQPAELPAPIGEPTTSRAYPPANFSRPLMGEPDARFPLRSMPLQDAIAEARKEAHLAPNRKGVISGAPAGVKTPEDLAAMRSELDRLVDVGSKYGSEKWYPTARGMVTDLAQGDAQKAPPIAYALGAGSKGRSPEASLDTLPKMHNAFLMGRYMGPGEHPPGVSTDVWLKYRRGRDKGEYEKIGAKIDPYTQDLDPTQPYASTAVNDRWHGRAFGYKTTKGDEWSDAFDPAQHRFMDAETLLATDRANANKFGGRSDWRPDEIQAMIWVAKRGESEGPLKPPSFVGPNQPAEINPEMYPQYLDKHTFQGTSGIVPGTATGMSVAKGTQAERDAYAKKQGGWADPNTGHDIYFGGAGMVTRPSLPMKDIYGGDTNLGEVARGLVGLEGSGKKKVIDQTSLDLVRYLQERRGYASQQNMSAGSVVSDVGNAKNSKGTSVIMPSAGLSSPQAAQAEALGAEHGLPSVVDYGDRTMLTDFGAKRPTITQERAGNIGARLAEVTGVPGKGRAANMISSEGPGYSGDMSELWGKPSAVTDHLLQTANNVPQHVINAIDNDPRILADTQRRLQGLLDEQKAGGHVPQEIINSMEILSRPAGPNGGMQGLVNARAAGVISLPVLALIIGPYVMPQAQPQGQGAMPDLRG